MGRNLPNSIMAMTTLKYSANSLGRYRVCPRFHWYYKIIGRRLVRSSTGRIAGRAIHAGIEGINRGHSIAEQDAAIDRVLAEETPIAPEDYRQSAFLKDALAAFRVEYAPLLKHFTVEEVECHGEIEIGQVSYRLPNSPTNERAIAHIIYEFRRDMVAVSPDGQRAVWDFKTASRNEQAEVLASTVSSAYKGYCWAYRKQTGKPCNYVQQRRIIMRKPSKSGVWFEFPEDGAIYFSDEILDEWHRHALRSAVEILERDSQDPDAWPMSGAMLGACRHQYGVCDFQSVCVLPPSDRALKLSTDEYQPSDTGKHRDAVSNGD